MASITQGQEKVQRKAYPKNAETESSPWYLCEVCGMSLWRHRRKTARIAESAEGEQTDQAVPRRTQALLAVARRQITEITSRFESAQRDSARRIKDLDKSLQEERKQRQAVEAEMRLMRSKMEQLRAERDKEAARLAQLEDVHKKLAAAESEIVVMRREIESLQARPVREDVESLERACAEERRRCARFEDEAREYSRQAEDFRIQFEDLCKAKEDVDEELADLRRAHVRDEGSRFSMNLSAIESSQCGDGQQDMMNAFLRFVERT